MIAILALLLGASTPAINLDDCDSRNRGTRISIHGDTDDDRTLVTYVKSTPDKCESATIVGRLGYSPDEDDVLSIPFGGSLTLRERTGGDDRALSLTRGADGQVSRMYQRNGRTAAYDEDARQWLAVTLPRVLAAAGVNVEARVARWKQRGGVDNVLRNIEGLGSSGSMRRHYEALLNGTRLSDDEMEATLRSVSSNMRGSSGDLRGVLSRLVPMRPLGKRSLVALHSALMSMSSSGDKSHVLSSFASRYLESGDRDVTQLWFRVAESIPSSGDLRNTLTSAMPYAQNIEVTRGIIDASRSIASSGDRSAVLMSLIRQGNLRDSAVRNAFMDVTASIPSDGDKARVLQALANLRD